VAWRRRRAEAVTYVDGGSGCYPIEVSIFSNIPMQELISLIDRKLWPSSIDGAAAARI
jgi:hypothetical protein